MIDKRKIYTIGYIFINFRKTGNDNERYFDIHKNTFRITIYVTA